MYNTELAAGSARIISSFGSGDHESSTVLPLPCLQQLLEITLMPDQYPSIVRTSTGQPAELSIIGRCTFKTTSISISTVKPKSPSIIRMIIILVWTENFTLD